MHKRLGRLNETGVEKCGDEKRDSREVNGWN